jgi:alcohol dehydrogenase
MINLIHQLRVGINGVALPMLHLPKPFCFVGADSSLSLCREIAGTGPRRILVVTDRPLLAKGLLDPMIASLTKAGMTVEVFSDVAPDPDYEMVLAGVERLGRFAADAVLAVGGGSPIDCAKAMLICHANDRHPWELTGIWLYAAPRKKCLPFFAVPTTAGTGSEVTIAAIVSDSREQVKHSIIDPKLVPSMVALDPRLMVGLPPSITAATGMDALTHAVEAYLSTIASEESDEYARLAAGSIVRNLTKAWRNGGDLDVRERMAVAACMAGLAFTRAGVGYVHAIAHQLGGLYHVPHGLANAIVLPHVLDFSQPHCTARLADLARVCGIGDPGAGEGRLAAGFIAHIRAMNAEMEIPATVRELQRADFDKIVERAFAEAHGTYGVPRYMTHEDATGVLAKLLPT